MLATAGATVVAVAWVVLAGTGVEVLGTDCVLETAASLSELASLTTGFVAVSTEVELVPVVLDEFAVVLLEFVD